MNKLFITTGLLAASFMYAQDVAAPQVEKQTWFHADVAETGVYGVNTQKALDFLTTNKRKPTPMVVGVLDSGVDFDHEDLADNMWQNPKEIAGNNKDDDGNGYVDDIYGWSFLGGENGNNVKEETLEVTRIYRKLKPVYQAMDSAQATKHNATEYALYLQTKQEIEQKLAEAKPKYEFYQQLYSAAKQGFPDLANDFGAEKKLTKENLDGFMPSTEAGNQAFMFFAQVPPEEYQDKTMQEFGDYMTEELKGGVDYFENQIKYHYNLDFNPREIIGDDYDNKKEKHYGNNDVEGPDARHGTHVAGLIAAVRGNDIGLDGIGGNHIKIMSVRTVPDGDEHDKDVANAIIYAVDNGAKILNMSFGKAYSPEKELVWEAIKYAESKDVLLIKAAGNANEDIDKHMHYPTNYQPNFEPVASNVITVGANTRKVENLKSSFSNFGKIGVDVFSPGSEIYSTIPNNKYEYLQGTSMASPIVAGVAALVWSHYPTLTAQQVKQAIEQSVNKNDALTALSVTGGVVDAYKAVQLAEKMSK